MRKASAVHKKDASIDDYEKIQTRSTIESSLITNSLMNNFGDFCIVYSNDQTVGKLASSTKSLLGSGSLVTVNTCGDDWKIVSTVPTSTILAEVYEIRSFTASTPVLSGASRTGWYIKPATMYAISANTDHPSEAAELLQFLVSSEDMALQQKLDKGVPFNQAAKDILQANGELEGIMIDADNTIDNTDTILMNPMFESSALTNAFSQACTSVHYGEATIEEAAKTAYETMKSAF